MQPDDTKNMSLICIVIIMNEEEQLKKRFKDLADKAYSRDICTFTNFLGLMELNSFYEISGSLNYVEHELFGGAKFCERKIVRFGSLNTPYPISCLHLTPSLKKFSDYLTHRDFLGAIINLGIKRETIGDIIVKDNEAFVFCLNNIADFIIQNLNRVKHTAIKCSVARAVPDDSFIKITKHKLNVASLRLDAVIGEVYRLSRTQAQLVIREKRVFVNGRLTENNSCTLKPEDAITVRKLGRFIFNETSGITKKGRFYISADIYE